MWQSVAEWHTQCCWWVETTLTTPGNDLSLSYDPPRQRQRSVPVSPLPGARHPAATINSYLSWGDCYLYAMINLCVKFKLPTSIHYDNTKGCNKCTKWGDNPWSRRSRVITTMTRCAVLTAFTSTTFLQQLRGLSEHHQLPQRCPAQSTGHHWIGTKMLMPMKPTGGMYFTSANNNFQTQWNIFQNFPTTFKAECSPLTFNDFQLSVKVPCDHQ